MIVNLSYKELNKNSRVNHLKNQKNKIKKLN